METLKHWHIRWPERRNAFRSSHPNWRNPNFCPQWWSKNDPYYPSYVQQGVTISENELDGLRFSSYDSAS